MPLNHDPFLGLPMFASDKEIAVAIVGSTRASKWLKESFPTLAARSGFPKIDEFHGGRPIPLVKLFYEGYLGVTGLHPGWKAGGKENLDVWKKSKRRGSP